MGVLEYSQNLIRRLTKLSWGRGGERIGKGARKKGKLREPENSSQSKDLVRRGGLSWWGTWITEFIPTKGTD